MGKKGGKKPSPERGASDAKANVTIPLPKPRGAETHREDAKPVATPVATHSETVAIPTPKPLDVPKVAAPKPVAPTPDATPPASGTQLNAVPRHGRALQALGYPQWECFDQQDIEQVQVLVAWLENQKIREYPEEERGALCDGKSSLPLWTTALQQYLDDLSLSYGLPAELLAPRPLQMLLQRLINFAIGLEYRDDAANYNRTAKAAERRSNLAGEVDDVNSPEVQAAVEAIAATLQVPLAATPAETLAAVRAVVQSYLTPDAVKREGKVQRFSQQAFALGFSTGDKSLDKAATVLRLLYINDLRQLQSRVNEVVAALQEFTANPKTDSKLGRVGH